jgi:D-3-phosphoglycerate dehydrogenase
MVGQISTCLADAKLNIAELLNKSRGEVRLHAHRCRGLGAGRQVLASIRAIEGVLSARLL